MANMTVTGMTEDQIGDIDKLAETGQTDRSKAVKGLLTLASQFKTLDEVRFCLIEGLKKKGD